MGTRQLRTCRATRVARQAQRGPELEAVPRRRAPANDRGTPVRRCSRGEGPEAPGPSPFSLRAGNGTHSRPLRARPPPGAARGVLWFSYWLFAACRAARAPAEPPGPGADALTGRSSEERTAAGPFVPGERTMPGLRFRIFRTPEVAHQHVSQSRSPGGRQPSSPPTVGPSGRCARGPPRHRRKGSHPLPWAGLPPAGTVVPSLADRRGTRKALLALGRRTGHHRGANPCACRDRRGGPTGGGLWGRLERKPATPSGAVGHLLDGSSPCRTIVPGWSEPLDQVRSSRRCAKRCQRYRARGNHARPRANRRPGDLDRDGHLRCGGLSVAGSGARP